MLGRRIAAHQPPPTCLPELRRALLDEWFNILQDHVDNLILSMPRRYNFKLQEQLSGGSVSPRGTTPADDRYIVLQTRRNRWQTAGEIARHTTQATGRPITRFTVARRLHGGGLFARRPVRCVPLTPAHRRRRSLWSREHRNWRDNEWGRVLFTDESRFSLSSDSHRILI
ncbi:transposable element Tcb1 transposase [Trichonephila clavipes]|nr:transposable element Tcb1 transposase [Trichonephila clavipes]